MFNFLLKVDYLFPVRPNFGCMFTLCLHDKPCSLLLISFSFMSEVIRCTVMLYTYIQLVHKITSKNHGCVWYDTIQYNSMPVSFSRNILIRFMLLHTPSSGSSPAVWAATSEQKYCNSCWVGQSPPSLPTQIHPTGPQILSSTTTLICVVIIQAKDRG